MTPEDFSKISEAQMPDFIRAFTGSIAGLVKATKPRPLFQNTWGDGLFLVFEGISAAGWFALELADRMAKFDGRRWVFRQMGSLRATVSPVGAVQDNLDHYPWGPMAFGSQTSGSTLTFTGDENDTESTSYHTDFRQLNSMLVDTEVNAMLSLLESLQLGEEFGGSMPLYEPEELTVDELYILSERTGEERSKC